MTNNSLDLNNLQSNQASYLAYNTNKNHNIQEEEIQINKASSAISLNISRHSQIMLVELENLDFSKANSYAQNSLSNIVKDKDLYNVFSKNQNEYFFDLKQIGYEGKSIDQLSEKQAKDLVSNDGYFSENQTSNRVAAFAINMSKDNLESLKAARTGIIKGFQEAQKLWNDNLPEISYKTQEITLRIIDAKIDELEQRT